MILVPGYEIIEKLYQKHATFVYRARRLADNHSVIIKLLHQALLSHKAMAKFQREVEIVQSIDDDGVVRIYEAGKHEQSHFLVYEDFAGVSLDTLCAGQSLSINQFFAIAMALSKALAAVHGHGIIHRDIKPANVIVHPQSLATKISDFGIAVRIGERDAGLGSLVGSVGYVSPEQSSRIEGRIDYRSDIYSLGVTCYEMLTGALPFAGEDPLEVVHAHLAKSAMPPALLNAEIPVSLSRVVMKMLAKIPAQRYQSAYGVYRDLQQCQQFWLRGEVAGEFVPGGGDVAMELRLSSRLYGRREQLAALKDDWLRACRDDSQGQLVVIHGHAGVGKSALIERFAAEVGQRYCILGKYDQQQSIFYSGIIEAFRQLLKKILASGESVAEWKRRFLEALGSNGQLIVDLIPELAIFIGAQPPVPVLSVQETQNRYLLTWANFVACCISGEHPLLLCLEDWQWADEASWQWLEFIAKRVQQPYFMIVASYRDQQDNSAIDERWRKMAMDTRFVALAAMGFDDVDAMVGDHLACSDETKAAIVRGICDKTAGNPLFVREFLLSLAKTQILRFNIDDCTWVCDLAQIEQYAPAPNVVELLLGKIEELPQKVRDVLQWAACLGKYFAISLMATITRLPKEEIHLCLAVAVEQGLLVESAATNDGTDIFYHFSHDRSQQACYSSIDEHDRGAYHYHIGSLLLQENGDGSPRQLFASLYHLNLGRDEILEQQQKDELAKLNLEAARKAKTTTAYQAAMEYLTAGIYFLGDNYWQNDYRQAFALHIEKAECEYLLGNYQQADVEIALLLRMARQERERFAVYRLQTSLYSVNQQNELAIQAGIRCLHVLGEKLREKPGKVQLIAEFLHMIWLLRSRAKASKANDDLLDILTILREIHVPSQEQNPALAIFIAIRLAVLTLQHDIAAFSALGYIYAAWFVKLLGRSQQGYRLAQQALAYNKHSAKKIEHYVYFRYISSIHFWHHPFGDAIDDIAIAYRGATEVGNLVLCGQIAYHHIFYMEISGFSLDKIKNAIEQYLKRHDHGELGTIGDALELWLQKIRYLQGEQDTFPAFADFFPEAKSEMEISHAKNGYNGHFCEICFFSGDYDAIDLDYAKHPVAMKICFAVSLYFFHSLLVAARYWQAPRRDRRKYLKLLEQSRKRWRQWMSGCAQNFSHIYYLVSAETMRIRQNSLEAMDFYDKAIHYAEQNGPVQHLAIAQEQAGKFYLALEKPLIALTYLRQAHYNYRQWGAQRRAKMLEQEYPQLLLSLDYRDDSMQRIFSTTAASNVVLDAYSLLKTSDALVQEMRQSHLLPKLLKITMQNAGADRGALLLAEDDQWFVVAQGKTATDVTIELDSTPLAEFANIAQTVVEYVRQTKEVVILDNAAERGIFTQDSYFQREQPKSVVCLPIIHHQFRLFAILYLENTLLTKAFTAERLKVLEILASQAAIALQNSHLYEDLQEQIATSKRLEKRVLQISDDEKLRLGRDLHDTLGQYLTSLQLINMATHRQLTAEQSPHVDKTGRTTELLEETIEQMRSLSRGMALLHLENKDLVAAIRDIVANVHKIGNVTCHFSDYVEIAINDLERITHIYRIVQEAIHNATKHGSAQNVWIYLRQNQQQVSVEIHNDGSDYPEPMKSEGIGVFTMKSRAALLHGTLQIKRRPQGGTIVRCVFPVVLPSR